MEAIIDGIKKESLPHVIDILEKNIININQQMDDEMGNYLVHIACYYNKSHAIIKKLLETADINVRNKQGVTPIMYAIQMGNVDVFKFLIEYQKLDINMVDNHGGTILHVMLRYRNYDDMEYTLKKATGINLEIRHYTEGTVLQAAVKLDLIDIVKLLIKFSADINVRDKEYKTLLMTTIITKKYKIGKILLESRCNVNAMDDKNNTALYYCCPDGDIDFTRELLRCNANSNIRCENLLTPLMIACKSQKQEMVALLLNYKAKKDLVCINGKTAKDYCGDNKQLLRFF